MWDKISLSGKKVKIGEERLPTSASTEGEQVKPSSKGDSPDTCIEQSNKQMLKQSRSTTDPLNHSLLSQSSSIYKPHSAVCGQNVPVQNSKTALPPAAVSKNCSFKQHHTRHSTSFSTQQDTRQVWR